MEGQSSEKVAPIESKDDENEVDEEQRRLENSLQQVLTNPLNCENIASRLVLADLKAASEVSRHFLQAIRGTRRFTQTAVLAITDKNLKDIKSFIRNTDFKWRGVKVAASDPTNILEDLWLVLHSVEFVSLEGWPWVIEDRAVKVETAANLLTVVLSSTPNLSQLKIDIRFLSSNVGVVLSSPAIQQTLRNLNRLDLVRIPELKCYWGNQPPRYFTNADEEDTFVRNFGLLAELPDRLKCFKLTHLTPSEEINVDSLNYSVHRLLRNNKATLEELELHLMVWRIQELPTLTFPALKALTASVEYDHGTLGRFLENQKSLKELTLTSKPWVMCRDTLTGIQNCSVGLKKLHLAGRSFDDLTVSDWSFLALMSRLKDFRLKMRGGLERASSLLASLPKNQLECLSLEGLSDMWSRPSGSWTLCGVQNEVQFKTELLEGFRCVRKLSFVASLDAVDDQLMQWLLKEFSLLEELQLSHCSKLTDAGISGKATAEWGRNASFADLRRLTTLKIVNCRGVTPNGVLESCVNVPSLKSLEYTNPRLQIVESVVLQLVEQNPRLERLILDYRGDLEELKGKLKKMNPRVELLLAEKDDW